MRKIGVKCPKCQHDFVFKFERYGMKKHYAATVGVEESAGQYGLKLTLCGRLDDDGTLIAKNELDVDCLACFKKRNADSRYQ